MEDLEYDQEAEDLRYQNRFHAIRPKFEEHVPSLSESKRYGMIHFYLATYNAGIGEVWNVDAEKDRLAKIRGHVRALKQDLKGLHPLLLDEIDLNLTLPTEVLGGRKDRKTCAETVFDAAPSQFYNLKPASDHKQQDQSTDGADIVIDAAQALSDATPRSKPAEPRSEEGHHMFSENRKGISYDKLFGPYLDGASRIVVTDPYVRYFYQIKNMMEFVEMIIQRKEPEDQVAIHLVTGPDESNVQKQRELLESITEACTGSGVDFTWAFDESGTAHARDIITDTGWKIVLDRGLDIFQAPIRRDGLNLSDHLQEHRMLKNFYVTYVRQ